MGTVLALVQEAGTALTFAKRWLLNSTVSRWDKKADGKNSSRPEELRVSSSPCHWQTGLNRGSFSKRAASITALCHFLLELQPL